MTRINQMRLHRYTYLSLVFLSIGGFPILLSFSEGAILLLYGYDPSVIKDQRSRSLYSIQ
jgi:hypothetical protein